MKLQLLLLAVVAVLCRCQQDPLTSIIEEKERIVDELAEVALGTFRSAIYLYSFMNQYFLHADINPLVVLPRELYL